MIIDAALPFFSDTRISQSLFV